MNVGWSWAGAELSMPIERNESGLTPFSAGWVNGQQLGKSVDVTGT